MEQQDTQGLQLSECEPEAGGVFVLGDEEKPVERIDLSAGQSWKVE